MTLLRRPGAAIATLLILVTGAAFLTQVVPYRQILDSRRQVDSAREQLAALKAENEVLGEEVEALNTPEEIERLARDKLGYVREGEVSYVVLDPPGSDQEPVAPTTEEEPADETWVDRIWDFLSGADVDSTG